MPAPVVITADDFGASEETVAATIECFERGALTGASIMANMPASGLALDYARRRQDLCFGVHLTYVSDGIEAPICGPNDIPGLVTPEGIFRPSNEIRIKALLGQLDVEEIARETCAQLDRVLGEGIPVSYVDSHGHLHKFAPFRKALLEVLPRFGIRRVRSVQDIWLKRPFRSPTYWLGTWWRQRIRSQFATTEHFYMNGKASESDWAKQVLAILPQESIEIGVHPGYSGWKDVERNGVQELAPLLKGLGRVIVPWSSVPN